jgi:hypothetical protein
LSSGLYGLQKPESVKIFVALSANDGTLIGFSELKNGSTISIPTPSGFNLDSSFVVGEYFYLNIPPDDFSSGILGKSVNYYTGLHVGDFKTLEYPTFSSTVVGTHQLSITDIPGQYYLSYFDGENINIRSLDFSDDKIDGVINLTKPTSDLYLSFNAFDEPTKFKYVSSINAGGSSSISFDEMLEMTRSNVALNTNASFYYSSYSVDAPSGYPINSAGGYSDRTASIPVYHPQTIFSEYFFSMWVSDENGSFNFRTRRATPPNSFSYLASQVNNVKYSGNKLSFSTTGAFDEISLSGGVFDFDSELVYFDAYTVLFSERGARSLVLPEIPAELISYEFLPPSEYDFTNANISDYPDLSGQSDYENKLVLSSDNVQRSRRNVISKGIYITPSGGRRATDKQLIQVPPKVKALLRDRLPMWMN